MKRITLLLILTVGFIGSSLAANMPEQSLSPMLKKVTPAIVNISVRGQLPPMRLPFGLKPNQLKPNLPKTALSPKFAGVGSGVIVDAQKGYILTNAHVIKDAKVIIVTLHDGRKVEGKLVGSDTKTDIAVIKINSKNLTAIEFGDSSKLNVGDFVAAIGNPFGIGQTVTSGVVSGLGRSHLGLNSGGYENYIQTDASINPGNSGGALVNLQGKLVGINTAIITPYLVAANVGIGLAIPSNMAKAILDQIIKYGKVEHSIIGIIVQNISPTLAKIMGFPNTKGALVADVNPGTPAAKAGLEAKDVILELNGHAIKNAYQVSSGTGLMRPGSMVKLEIRRGGKILNIATTTISIKKAKEMAKNAKKPLLTGLSLQDASQLQDNQIVKGIQIMRVGAFSFAYSCGLRPGDIILSAAGKSVETVEQLKTAAANNPDHLLLKVKPFGKGASIFIVLEK